MGNDELMLRKIYANPDAVTYIFESEGQTLQAVDMDRNGTIDSINVENKDASKTGQPSAFGALRFADEFDRLKAQVEQAVSAFFMAARSGETENALPTQLLEDALRWPLGEERKDGGSISRRDACLTQKLISEALCADKAMVSYTVTDADGNLHSIEIFINPIGLCRYTNQVDEGFQNLIRYLDQTSNEQSAKADNKVK